MNYATQEKIRRNLCNGKIDVSQVTNDERSLYEKIIKRHMTELNQIIVQKYSIFNVSFAKGIFLALCSFLYGYLFYTYVFYSGVILPVQTVGWSQVINNILIGWHVKSVPLELLTSPLILALVLGVLAYKSFYKAWNIKKDVHSDLLRDEAVLARLEKAV